jgi:hypothetical protein
MAAVHRGLSLGFVAVLAASSCSVTDRLGVAPTSHAAGPDRPAPAGAGEALAAVVVPAALNIARHTREPSHVGSVPEAELTPPGRSPNGAEPALGAADTVDGTPGAREIAELQAYSRPVAHVDPDRALVSTAKVTQIHRRPSFQSPRIGHLRAGAVVRRSAEPAGHEGCKEGFYEIVPEGFVCVGRAASLDPDHQLARAVSRRADRAKGLPYPYAISPLPGAPFYMRIPTREEQAVAEPDLSWQLAHPNGAGFGDFELDEVPWFLQDGQSGINVRGLRHPKEHLFTQRAIPNSGYSFLSLFEANGRKWGLTADMVLLPLDRLRAVEPSRFHGLPLSEETPLPVVFVRAKGQALYSGDPKRAGLKFERMLEFRQSVPITGESIRIGNRKYLETRDGHWIVDEHLVRIDPMKVVPRWAKPGRTWMDVSLLKQALVAYEGTTPVFVTLISSGIDGISDPEETHATIQGRFLIHTKHVSITMSSDEVGEEFDLRDVPYVQYFTQGYALHAAYWHDAFGTPRSHGCINLSPLDARWLFGWTDPPVPSAWHGAMSLRDGTLVSIHP